MKSTDLLPDSASLPYVEELLAEYLRDPASVDESWRAYFKRLVNGRTAEQWRAGPAFTPPSLFGVAATLPAPVTHDAAHYQHRIDELIRSYRVRGHISARVDPLGRAVPRAPELDPAFYGLTEEDLDRPFAAATLRGAAARTLGELLELLEETYCRHIGAQFMHIDDLTVRQWLQDRMEGTRNRLKLARDEQVRILTRLTDAVIFEEFLQRKFQGAKSFSLEGGESLIPLLDLAIEAAGEHGVREVVVGMAHRGRLNVLANIMGKAPRLIFAEFADSHPEANLGRGDVKYHLGYSSDWTTVGGRAVHLSLCFNPSHLEFVNPVALGRMRAKQDRHGDLGRHEGLVIQIHGDAAFAGEGVIQETLNLSQLPGYTVGGAIHVIVNNQIGFTTDPEYSRSTTYATDVAKMLQSPIFHVNGEDPEAVAQVVRLAMDFRRTFARDVVIDMYCYRRRGHNEGDEPAFTQPLLYQAIAARPSVREGYLSHLLQLGEVTQTEADALAYQRQQALEADLARSRAEDFEYRPAPLDGIWRGYYGGTAAMADDPDTRVEAATLADWLTTLGNWPDDFHPHPKIERLLRGRREMARGERPLDWAMGETLGLASLAAEGVTVRLSGQDAERGTFSHRHGVLHDVVNGYTYTPLRHISHNRIELVNSPLAEVAPLGFEYGYSLEQPDGLILWEAQFGDFVNVAQVMIDQFIVSAEDKWRRLSKLVMLLPHGMEGQGPEHSSARVERFLALGADDNFQVCWPSTPSQMFHLLRRQGLRHWSKPLIVMTPKSLLRRPEVVSPLDDLAEGHFAKVLADPAGPVGEATRRILLCSGKVYYDLAERRARDGHDDVAILRLEELFPLPKAELRAALGVYPKGTPVVWVQEEPENMGAWRYLFTRFPRGLFERHPLSNLCRPAAASPASGSGASHRLEQERLLAAAMKVG